MPDSRTGRLHAIIAKAIPSTVTNYFPLKEDLVFDRAGKIVEMPAAAVAARSPQLNALQSRADGWR
jgi:hypothetical protein